MNQFHNKFYSLVIGILFCWSTVQADGKHVVCVFDMQATERNGDARFTIDDINPNLCTHMIAHSSLGKDFDFIESDQYKKFIDTMKSKNPKVKILLSLSSDSLNERVEELLTSNINIASLVNMTTDEVLGLVHYVHKVHGVILKSPPRQYSTLNYNNIIIALKNAFQPHGYLLAVLGDSNLYGTIPEDYDISILSQSVDFLLLETDNYFPSKENKLADHNAPLYKRSWDTKDETNVDYEVSQWIKSGFPARKIIINIPLYGKSWKLSSNQINPPAPSQDKATPKYVLWSGLKESGYMTYLDICLVVKNRKWKVFQDPNETMGPYAVSPSNDRENNGTYWVGYDDVDMAVVKSNYVLSKKLGGIYLGNYNFDISADDFNNTCGGGRYPMLKAVHNTLTSSASKFNCCLPIFITLLLLSTKFLNF